MARIHVLNTKKYRKLKDQIKALEDKLQEHFYGMYPVGGQITWKTGNSEQTGRVLMHPGWGGRLRLYVKNDRTAKEYWITDFDVDHNK